MNEKIKWLLFPRKMKKQCEEELCLLKLQGKAPQRYRGSRAWTKDEEKRLQPWHNHRAGIYTDITLREWIEDRKKLPFAFYAESQPQSSSESKE
jgi:hypothetical protein